ncbi:MAG: AAA family ATPase, partial [Anaerolineae bacterium]
MITRTRIVLAGPGPFIDEARAALRYAADFSVIGVITRPGDMDRQVASLRPDVVIVDDDWGEDALTEGGEIARRYSECVVILSVVEEEPGIFNRAIRHGFAGIIAKPVTPDRIEEIMSSQHESLKRFGTVSGREHGLRYARSAKQEIVVFYSPKGGVGKTTLSINFAAACLNERSRLNPVVIDLDSKADVVKMLQAKTFVTLSQWVDLKGQGLDRKTVESLT